MNFPEHKAGMTLIHNSHKGYYKPVAEWIADQAQTDDGEPWFDWVSEEERVKAIELDSVWTIQWYPDTPVGFFALAASNLDALLESARKY